MFKALSVEKLKELRYKLSQELLINHLKKKTLKEVDKDQIKCKKKKIF